MKRTENSRWICYLGSAITIICINGPAAFALSHMGPPTSGLEQEDFKIGADYSYSEMDLEFNNGKYVEYLDGWFDASGSEPDLKLKDFETNTIYVNIGYGITDNVEVFFRLGGTKAEFSGYNFWPSGEEFDSNTDFAIGGGMKATFYEADKLKIGGLIQIDWSDLDGAIRPKEWPVADDTVTFDLTQVQIAVGPSYELTDRILIYGGPFLHFVYGDWEDVYNQIDPITGGLLTTKTSWDVEEDSYLGAYIGTQIELAENSTFMIEYQYTSSADAVGASIAFRF
ncbi:MAG: outer membrane protein [Planctomycetota bacterium]|jgi:opacity protein-like surface antigen